MFFEERVKVDNKFQKYLLGSIIIIVASFIGQFPLLIGILYKVYFKGFDYPLNNEQIMSFFDSNITLILLLLPFVFAMFAIYLVNKKNHKKSFVKLTTSRKKIDWKRILFSFTIWGFLATTLILISYILNPEQYKLNFDLIPFLSLSLIVILLIPIQTSAEEYFFRGYLMQGLNSFFDAKWIPLFITSSLFGLLHFSNPEVAKVGNEIFIYYIGTGLFLGIITLMDDGVELALGFHAANNIVSALLVTSDWSVFKTHAVFRDISEPKITFDIILPVVVIYPILLLIFSEKYKWQNWKLKLIRNKIIKKN